MQWTGVLPAITTPFTEDLAVDHVFLARHAGWMLDAGCTGIVALGSLGEGATLETEEKHAVLATLVEALDGRAPVVAGISALATGEAVRLAEAAARIGCSGLMVLPPYVYVGDEEEMEAHVEAVVRATDLSCMLYNNPIAYGTDFRPERVAALAERNPNLHAVKESSGDVRRITALVAEVGDRLAVSVGLDDAVVEGVGAGAVGWVAGLVNAFPAESVALFEAARDGDRARAEELYRWFLPLLRLDTVPKFVQYIKLVQELVDQGSARVRAPRREATPSERAVVGTRVLEALARRPSI
jgi:4-hydroxy-tetrahydrodipicolinate synthase